MDNAFLIMLIGLSYYLLGIVLLLFQYDYYHVKKYYRTWFGVKIEKNKDTDFYNLGLGFLLAIGFLSLIVGIGMIIFSFYMIANLIGLLLILILLLIVTKFLTGYVRGKLKKHYQREEELRKKDIEQTDELILQKLSKEK